MYDNGKIASLLRTPLLRVQWLFLALLLAVSAPVFAYDDAETDPPTKEEIAKWRTEAEQNDAEAQFNLGEAYLKGDGGLPQSDKEASKWYYKSAMQGFSDAQFAMGFVYRGGGGIPMNKVLSYMWFDLAAKNGDYRAYSLRNDVAWSMTEPEIEEARKKSKQWEPVTNVTTPMPY
ncbi:MAG TPA: tetratricopeptide repeat protein [Rickettsiales bacterium]|nr:tetratricopeptide repeat protein [Rickettsiales bacterium]